MKHRPDINDEEVVLAVDRFFTIQISDLEFLPIGEGSWVFKATGSRGSEWFVKLSRQDTSNIAHVTAYLHDDLGLDFVLSPLIPKGPRLPRVRDYFLAVYPFIHGALLASIDNAQYKSEIGRDLARLHDATLPPNLQSLIPHETFDKFQDSAKDLIQQARRYVGNDDLLLGLRDKIVRWGGEVDALLINARKLSSYCKTLQPQLVICHADIHPFNIMRSGNDLVFIDWDGVMAAPRERDLMFYSHDLRKTSDLLRAYTPAYALNKDLISYYNYEWVLQEFTDYIERLFDKRLADEARRHALNEFVKLFGAGDKLGGVVKNALDSKLPKQPRPSHMTLLIFGMLRQVTRCISADS